MKKPWGSRCLSADRWTVVSSHRDTARMAQTASKPSYKSLVINSVVSVNIELAGMEVGLAGATRGGSESARTA